MLVVLGKVEDALWVIFAGLNHSFVVRSANAPDIGVLLVHGSGFIACVTYPLVANCRIHVHSLKLDKPSVSKGMQTRSVKALVKKRV